MDRTGPGSDSSHRLSRREKLAVNVFANPFLACGKCGKRVVWKDEDKNVPCGCRAGFYSVCESWTPWEGCLCRKQFGGVPHGLPLYVEENE